MPEPSPEALSELTEKAAAAHYGECYHGRPLTNDEWLRLPARIKAVEMERATAALSAAGVPELLARLDALEAENDRQRRALAARFSDPGGPSTFARLLMASTLDAAATERELQRLYHSDPVVHALVSYGRAVALRSQEAK